MVQVCACRPLTLPVGGSAGPIEMGAGVLYKRQVGMLHLLPGSNVVVEVNSVAILLIF